MKFSKLAYFLPSWVGAGVGVLGLGGWLDVQLQLTVDLHMISISEAADMTDLSS